MKRLFQVRDLMIGRALPLTFADKMRAKHYRDSIEGTREPDAPRRYVVTPGPDHWKYDEGGQQDHGQQREEREA